MYKSRGRRLPNSFCKAPKQLPNQFQAAINFAKSSCCGKLLRAGDEPERCPMRRMTTMVRIVVRIAAMLALGAAWAVSANSGNPEVRVRVQDPKAG